MKPGNNQIDRSAHEEEWDIVNKKKDSYMIVKFLFLESYADRWS